MFRHKLKIKQQRVQLLCMLWILECYCYTLHLTTYKLLIKTKNIHLSDSISPWVCIYQLIWNYLSTSLVQGKGKVMLTHFWNQLTKLEKLTKNNKKIHLMIHSKFDCEKSKIWQSLEDMIDFIHDCRQIFCYSV